MRSNQKRFHYFLSFLLFVLFLADASLSVTAQVKRRTSSEPTANKQQNTSKVNALSEGDSYREKARKELRAANYQQAIDDFSTAIVLNPQDDKAYYQRGFAKQYLGYINSAGLDYREAIRIKKKNAADVVMLCVLYSTNLYEYSQVKEPTPESAIADCSQAIKDFPIFALLYYQRATIYRDQNEIDKALADFKKAAEYAPRFDNARLNISSIYLLKKDFKNAITYCEDIIASDPKMVTAYITRGLAYYNLGQYDEAIADFNEALLLNPNSINAYLYRGKTYLKKNNYESAFRDLNIYTQYDSLNPAAYDNRALAYFQRSDYDNALKDYNKSIELSPKNATYFINRATVYEAKKEFDAAIADYQKSIELDPNSELAKKALQRLKTPTQVTPSTQPTPVPLTETTSNLKINIPAVDAPSQRETAQLKAAISLKIILQALQTEKIPTTEQPISLSDRNKTVMAAVKVRGIAFILTPDNEKRLRDAGATDDVIKLIRKESDKIETPSKIHNLADTYINLGDKAFNQKDYEVALENYNKAIEIDANNEIAYNQRGKLYQRLAANFLYEKNYDEAKKHLDKAIADLTEYIRINPTSVTAFYNRAICYYMKFSPNLPKEETMAIGQKAIDDFTRAITLNEGAQAAYEWRAKTYRYLGQLDKAAADEQILRKLKQK